MSIVEKGSQFVKKAKAKFTLFQYAKARELLAIHEYGFTSVSYPRGIKTYAMNPNTGELMAMIPEVIPDIDPDLRINYVKSGIDHEAGHLLRRKDLSKALQMLTTPTVKGERNYRFLKDLHNILVDIAHERCQAYKYPLSGSHFYVFWSHIEEHLWKLEHVKGFVLDERTRIQMPPALVKCIEEASEELKDVQQLLRYAMLHGRNITADSFGVPDRFKDIWDQVDACIQIPRETYDSVKIIEPAQTLYDLLANKCPNYNEVMKNHQNLKVKVLKIKNMPAGMSLPIPSSNQIDWDLIDPNNIEEEEIDFNDFLDQMGMEREKFSEKVVKNRNSDNFEKEFQNTKPKNPFKGKIPHRNTKPLSQPGERSQKQEDSGGPKSMKEGQSQGNGQKQDQSGNGQGQKKTHSQEQGQGQEGQSQGKGQEGSQEGQEQVQGQGEGSTQGQGQEGQEGSQKSQGQGQGSEAEGYQEGEGEGEGSQGNQHGGKIGKGSQNTSVPGEPEEGDLEPQAGQIIKGEDLGEEPSGMGDKGESKGKRQRSKKGDQKQEDGHSPVEWSDVDMSDGGKDFSGQATHMSPEETTEWNAPFQSFPAPIHHGEGGKRVITDFDVLELSGEFPKNYEAADADNSDFNKLLMELKKRLLSNAKTKTKTNLYSGRINPRRLTKIETMIGPDIPMFQEIIRSKSFKRTKVTLLIDESGSMRSDLKYFHARRSAILFSKVLRNLKIDFEVIGFTTIGNYNVRFPACVNRFDCLHHIIYKEFGKPLVPHRLGGIEGRNGANADGESLFFAACRIVRQRADRRIIFVFSDGHPNVSGSYDVRDDLKQTVALCLQSKIEVYGIGILDDSVKLFYPDWIVIRDSKKLPAEFFQKLSKVLAQTRH